MTEAAGHGPRRVAVVGATGFLGRPIVRAFVRAGHPVTGLVRSAAGARVVERDGATPVLGDLLRPETVAPAVRGAAIVVHVAQSDAPSMAERRAVRVEGTRNLMAAMRAEGTEHLVLGSGYWVYASREGSIVEESPVAPRSISQVNFEAEEVVRAGAAHGTLRWQIVRPGMVYGPGSWFAEMAAELASGAYRYIEPGDNFLSPIHYEDLGAAFVRIAKHGAHGATYLAVDDEPVRTRDFAAYVASQLGAPPPRAISAAAAECEWGEDLAALNAASRGASNARLRALGWAPRFPTYREGVPDVLGGPGPWPRGPA
jgi:nucleoside-diphosphate-sugar epimerase